MLVLQREEGQSIHISGGIVVTVKGFLLRDPDTGQLLGRPRVILGIEAPKDVQIDRDDAVRRDAGGGE